MTQLELINKRLTFFTPEKVMNVAKKTINIKHKDFITAIKLKSNPLIQNQYDSDILNGASFIVKIEHDKFSPDKKERHADAVEGVAKMADFLNLFSLKGWDYYWRVENEKLQENYWIITVKRVHFEIVLNTNGTKSFAKLKNEEEIILN